MSKSLYGIQPIKELYIVALISIGLVAVIEQNGGNSLNYKSIILLGFAVVAIGIFIIPSTLSMFVGQHQWFSVRTAESQYDLCERCHSAEVGEWKANRERGGAHSSYLNEGSAGDPGCFCHQVNETRLSDYGIDTTNIDNFNFEIFNESGGLNDSAAAFNTAWRTNLTPHAALTIACVDCHLNASSQLNNTNEAHKALYNASLNIAATSDDISENTACLACHTMVGLSISMERIESGITIIANHTNYTSEGWSLDISINRTDRTSDSTYWAPNQSS